jgi:cytochrome b561
MTSSSRPEPAYGRVTKTFHWLTVALLATQFTVGYFLDVDGRGDLDVFGDDALLTVHVLLGVTILVVAAARRYWRHRTTLPPWAEGLSPAERTQQCGEGALGPVGELRRMI